MNEYKPIYLPCGSTAFFDHGSGCSHRCWDCMATVGSVGMPKECKEKMDAYNNWEELGGKGWNYEKGCVE